MLDPHVDDESEVGDMYIMDVGTQSDDELLYPGSSLTDAHLLIMQYSLKHSLTKRAQGDLLGMLRVFLPCGHKLPTSFFTIKKFFERRCSEVTQLRNVSYCSRCHSPVTELEDCPNGCSKPVHDFLYIPVAPQLKRMAKGMSYY